MPRQGATAAEILAYLDRLSAAGFTGRVDILAHFNGGGISRAWAMREESLSEAGRSVQRSASPHEVKDLLGHSLVTVLRYAHLAPENLRSAVSRLDVVLAPTVEAQHNSSTSAVARDNEGVTVARNPSP
jgi:hypothetical protein